MIVILSLSGFLICL